MTFNTASCSTNKHYRMALDRFKLPNMFYFHIAPREATDGGKYLCLMSQVTFLHIGGACIALIMMINCPWWTTASFIWYLGSHSELLISLGLPRFSCGYWANVHFCSASIIWDNLTLLILSKSTRIIGKQYTQKCRYFSLWHIVYTLRKCQPYLSKIIWAK